MTKGKGAFRSQKHQTRLQFQSLPVSSPDKALYSDSIQDRLANVRYAAKMSSSNKTTRSTKPLEENSLPTPEPSSQTGRYDLRSSSPVKDSSSPPQNAHARSATSSDEDVDDLITPSSKRRKFSQIRQNSVEDVDTPVRRSSRHQPAKSTSRTKSLVSKHNVSERVSFSSPSRKNLDMIGSPETSGDEEVVLVSQPTNRGRRRRDVLQDRFIVDDDYIDGHLTGLQPKPKSKSKTKRDNFPLNFIAGEDEIEFISSGSEDLPQSHRSRNKNSKHRRRSRREQEELDDDLKDLQDSSQEENAPQERTRGGPVTTQREERKKHLDVLRKKRIGRKPHCLQDSDEEEDILNSDGLDIDEITKSPGGSDNYNNVIDEHLGWLQRAKSAEISELPDNADDDFIIDDSDEAPLGRPHPDMPLAFTSYASRKPRELFIHIIEWLVKNKLAPAFSRNDELFRLSWDRVNDQIKAQAGSRLISSAWNADFKHVVLARPQMEVSMVGHFDENGLENCDACNKTNHPARYEFIFSGEPYNLDTLEPVEFSDNEDEQKENDDQVSYDQDGHALAPESTRFYLGRFCAANAEMGHKLTHWKHHLNQSLMEYLEEQGVMSAQSIIARERLNKKKREREAEAIVDSMEATGMIAKLWQDLQDDLDDARFGMEGHEAKGGRRSTARIGAVRISRGDGSREGQNEAGRRRVTLQDDSDQE